MGFFDSLQLKKRLESAASDVGKSIVTGLTPKSPVPLSAAGLQKAATDKATKTMADGETKAKGKVKDLEKATVGKVGSAIQGKIDNTASRVEAKFDGTLAKAEGKVDAGIAKVGDTVDAGIAKVDSTIDKTEAKATAFVSGKKKVAAPAAAPAPTAAPAAESVEEKAAPDDAGAAPVVMGRKRSNAVTAKPAEEKAEEKAAEPVVVDAEAEVTAEAKVDEPAAAGKADEPAAAAADEPAAAAKAEEKADGEDDDIIPSWFFDDDSEEKFAAMETAAPDPYADDDVRTDLKGAAATAANDRKAGAGGTNEVDITEEDASEFEHEDDFGDDSDVSPEDKKGAEDENDEDLTDKELEQLTSEAKVDQKDQQTAVRNYKKKLREISGQLAATLGGGLATAKVSEKDATSSKDPWVAYFIASAKFRKKLAKRDLKEELAGVAKEEEEQPADATPEDDADAKDDVETAEDEPGREDPDKTEIELKGGLVYRSQKSPMEGDTADTTDAELGGDEGRQIWVADKSHKIFLAYRPIEKDDHTQLLGADDIAVGGEIRIEAGKIDFMSNDRRGDQEDAAPFVDLLRALRDNQVAMKFRVFEASKKSETMAEDLLEEADKAEPKPEEADLVAEMAKNDKWKTVAKDFPEKVILDVAQEQKWELVSGDIVDATGAAVDPTAARELLQKHMSKANAAEAAALVAEKLKAKAGAAVGG